MKIKKIKCSYYDIHGTGPYQTEVCSVDVIEDRVDLVIKEIKKMHPDWEKVTIRNYETEPGLSVSEFIEKYMHNNEIVVENRDNYQMSYYFPNEDEKFILMDWELRYTDISDCEIICIKNVHRKYIGQHITVKIDTDKKFFVFEKNKVTLDNAPLWLYNKTHGTNIEGCCAG